MNNKTEKNQRNRRTIKISETLKDIVDLSSSKSNKLEFIVNAQWPEIVGNFFAEHSEPYKLNIINKNNNYNQNSLYQGILEVKITPAAAIEFQHFNDKIIEKEQKQGEFPFILHCFTGGPKLASRAVELGGFISFSGIITFRNASELRAIASNVPNERLLIETDAPYLAPVPVRGKRNEPANLIYTFKELARIKNCSEEELAVFTTNNFFRLFSKMPNQDV